MWRRGRALDAPSLTPLAPLALYASVSPTPTIHRTSAPVPANSSSTLLTLAGRFLEMTKKTNSPTGLGAGAQRSTRGESPPDSFHVFFLTGADVMADPSA